MLATEEIKWLKDQNIGQIVSIERLHLALTNDVFLITNFPHSCFVFKRLNRLARSANDRQAELLVQELASEHDLTPKVIAQNKYYKLQNYIEGEILGIESNTRFTVLAEQLLRIHKLPVLYAPKQRLVFELLKLKQHFQMEIDESYFAEILELAKSLDESCCHDTLCHGDLSLSNVLHGMGNQYYVLDWEYAVIACDAYDLAFCICINSFTESESDTLISQYYSQSSRSKKQSLESLQNKCQLYLKVFNYINKLWSGCFIEKK